ncbi:MAG: hypothetical protein LQ344_005421 [Seirophora lacunosa]|nr:MAG: hypothetical protein LQ344_005421 [Seirophora lacunosa]
MFRSELEVPAWQADHGPMGRNIHGLNIAAWQRNPGAEPVGRYDDPCHSPGPDLRHPLCQWGTEDTGGNFPEQSAQDAGGNRYPSDPLSHDGTRAPGGLQVAGTRPLAPKTNATLGGHSLPFTQPKHTPEHAGVVTTAALEPLQQSFNQDMSPAPRRRRRKFSAAEKKRISLVRKQGACPECKSKKRKCVHVADSTDDGPSPSSQGTESENSEPPTPESDCAMSDEDGCQNAIPEGFSFEDYLNSDLL